MKKLTEGVLLGLGFDKTNNGVYVLNVMNTYDRTEEPTSFGLVETDTKFLYVLDGVLEFTETKELIEHIAMHMFNEGVSYGRSFEKNGGSMCFQKNG